MHVVVTVLAVWLALSAAVGVAWARALSNRPRVRPRLAVVRRQEEKQRPRDLAG